MPFNGSGTFNLTAGNPVATGTVIESSWANTTLSDIALNGLTNTLTIDGQSAMSGQLKLTNGTVSIPALTFSASTSTGLYRPGTNLMAATVSGVEGMRWASTGAVMIGQTTDDTVSKLQVTGATKLTGALGVTGATTLSSTLGVTGATTLSSTLGVTGATTLTTLTTSGNTTIGGSLAVTGGISGALTGITDLTTTGNTILGNAVGDTLNVANGSLQVSAAGNVGMGAASSGVERLRVDSTNPTNGILAVLQNAGSTSGAMVQLSHSGIGSWSFGIMPALNAFAVYQNRTTANAGTELLRINSSGNVGIGVAPISAVPLLVHTGSNRNVAILDQSSAASITSVTDAGSSAPLRVVGNTLSFSGNGSADHMRLDASGNLGVGTTSPNARLHVSGAIGASTAMVNSATLPTSGQRFGLFAFGADGETVIGQARISAFAEGNWTTNTSSPTYMTFNTTPSGSPTSVERVRIDASGNVGVGLTPSYKLHVSGTNYQVVATNGTNSNVLGASGGVSYVGSIDATPLLLQTGNAERARVDASGNFYPATNGGQTLGTSTRRWSSVYGTAFSDGADVLLDTSSTTVRVGAAATWTGLNLYTGGTARLQIDSSGNVGIGIAPTELLDVQRSTGSDIAARVKNTGAGRAVLKLDSGSGSTADVRFYENATQRWSIQSATGSNVLSLVDASAGERMRIDSSGNVGIGVTPTGGQGLLQVAGGIKTTQGLNVTGNGGFFNAANKFGIDVNSATSRLYASGSDASTRGNYEFHITDSVGSLDMVAMRISNTGAVGIGSTPVAGYLLDVAGSITVRRGAGTSAVLSLAGNNTTPGSSSFDLQMDASSNVDVVNRSNTRMSFYTNAVERLQITAAGVIQDSAGKELGFKGLPDASVTTGAFAASDRGKCVYATAGVTVPNNTMAGSDVVTIINTTGSAITITATITTLRLAGTALTGNRTLAAYGIASIVFFSGTVAVISGNVT